MRHFLQTTLIALLGFIAFVLLLEGIYRVAGVPKISHGKTKAKAQELIPLIDSNTVLVIGDSKMEWGINSNVIVNKLKTQDRNLGFVNMAMPGSSGEDVLRYLLEKKVYPKMILQGFDVFYGSYNNHGFDQMKYNTFNRLVEQIAYFFDKNFYFRDPSVLEYIINGSPYFKNHEYDSWGGAMVTENGDYTQRAAQQKFFAKNNVETGFSLPLLIRYCHNLNSMIATFEKNGTLFCGVSLPASKEINDIRKTSYGATYPHINFRKYYNYIHYTYTLERPAPDSVFFYDGAHLSREYTTVFCAKMIDSIINDFPGLR